MLVTACVCAQMVFAVDQLFYCSDLWKTLNENKEKFISEEVILQYIGFVKTHMKLIQTKKHSGTPRERKIFYNVCTINCPH